MSEAATSLEARASLDARRADFPILAREVHGQPLVYFDSAATAQRPLAVTTAVDDFYRRYNANVHRGVHSLSGEATDAFEGARETLRALIGARSTAEIVFPRGSTESVNLVAQSFVRPSVGPGDEILVSHMEHHSNLVPWQMVCEQTGATLKVIPIDRRGDLDMAALPGLLNERVKMLALVHVSNALGTINPVSDVCAMARDWGIPTLLDGAQATPHLPVDVQEIGCDFYTVSGHKMYGPTGIGIVYGREALLEAMPPWQGGGEMIREVTLEKTTYNDLPNKFEAGTPNIAGAIGLGAAAQYLNRIGFEAIRAHEHDLLEYATARVKAIEGLRLIGEAEHKTGVVAFTVDGIHPHDIGTLIDHEGVAIRTGHHCAMPLMQFFGVPATARASFGLYNTREEVDRFIPALEKVVGMLQ